MFKRLYELLLKFLSVKGMFVLFTSTTFLISQNEFTSFSMLFSWAFFILGREVFKIIDKLKGK